MSPQGYEHDFFKRELFFLYICQKQDLHSGPSGGYEHEIDSVGGGNGDRGSCLTKTRGVCNQWTVHIVLSDCVISMRTIQPDKPHKWNPEIS